MLCQHVWIEKFDCSCCSFLISSSNEQARAMPLSGALRHFFILIFCAMSATSFVREFPLPREDFLSLSHVLFIHIMVLLVCFYIRECFLKARLRLSHHDWTVLLEWQKPLEFFALASPNYCNLGRDLECNTSLSSLLRPLKIIEHWEGTQSAQNSTLQPLKLGARRW